MKQLVKLVRVSSILVSLPSVFVGILLALIAMLWWQFVGLLTAVTGKRGRKHISRWLGCYPFIYTLLLLLWLVALFHWGATGDKIKPFYARLCTNCLEKVEGDKGLAKIGGLW